jgi:diketogulonate reductase-like aldo/keto reductase
MKLHITLQKQSGKCHSMFQNNNYFFSKCNNSNNNSPHNRNGFHFIDTACQPKHYNKALVGKGWTKAAKELGLSRRGMFLQTKFTPISGQDPNNIPYGTSKLLQEMVAESLQVLLHNLQTTYLDSWVMHSPLSMVEETMVAYHVMEQAIDDGKVKHLGISNCYNLDWLSSIYDKAHIKPLVLQNCFYGKMQWDQDI